MNTERKTNDMHTIDCNTCGHHMEGADEAAVVIELQWHVEWGHEPAELVTFTYRHPEYVEPTEIAKARGLAENPGVPLDGYDSWWRGNLRELKVEAAGVTA